MEVGKWKMAQTWRHFKRPASSKGLWKQFVDDSKERDQMSQGGTPQLVQPGPGRQGYRGDDWVTPLKRDFPGKKFVSKRDPTYSEGRKRVKTKEYEAFLKEARKVEQGEKEMVKLYDDLKTKHKRNPRVWEMHSQGKTRWPLTKIKRILEKNKLPLDEPRGGLKKEIISVYNELKTELGRPPKTNEVAELITKSGQDAHNQLVYVKHTLNNADLSVTASDAKHSPEARKKAAETIKKLKRVEYTVADDMKAQLFDDIRTYKSGTRVGPQRTMAIMDFAKYFPEGTSEVVISRQINRLADDMDLEFKKVSKSEELAARKVKDAIKKEGDPTWVSKEIKGTKEKPLHHMRAKGFMIDNEIKAISPSLADLTYLDVVTNSEKLQNVERLRNNIVREQMELFKNKPEGWKIRLKQLNFQSRHLANKMPKDLKGLIYFEQMDEVGSFKAIGGNPMKSICKLSNESKIKFNTLSRGSLEREKILSVVDDLKKSGHNKTATNVLNQLNSGLPIDEIMKMPGMKKAMPWIKGEAYFAFADMLNNWTKGQSFWKGLGKGVEMATFNIVDFNTDEMALIHHALKKGVPENEIKAMVDYMNYKKEGKKLAGLDTSLAYLDHSKDIGGELTPSHILNPEEGYKYGDRERLTKGIAESKQNLEKLYNTYYEGENRDPTIGLVTLENMMESLTAEEWNKTAGIPGIDRGYREMVGAKADEGMVWGPIFGSSMREFFESIGGEETDSLKAFKPQELMSAHPVYGYKEQIKDMESRGYSPMEDIRGHFDYALPKYAQGGIVSLLKK